MRLRRRLHRLERDAREALTRHGEGADALGRRATAFMVAVDLRLDYDGRLADPAPREARYRERLAAYGLEFVEELDRPRVERLAEEVTWLGPGRRACVKSTT